MARWRQVEDERHALRRAAAYALPTAAAWQAWRVALPPVPELPPFAPVGRKVARAVLVEVQGSVCAVCLMPLEYFSWVGLDHAHDSGLVRGALCARCNVREGMRAYRTHAVFAAYRARPPALDAHWYDEFGGVVPRGHAVGLAQAPAYSGPQGQRPPWISEGR